MKRLFLVATFLTICAPVSSDNLPTKTQEESAVEIKKAHQFLQNETSSGLYRIIRAIELADLNYINELRIEDGLKPYTIDDFKTLVDKEIDSPEAD